MLHFEGLIMLHFELYNNGEGKWLFFTTSWSWCFKHRKVERWGL